MTPTNKRVLDYLKSNGYTIRNPKKKLDYMDILYPSHTVKRKIIKQWVVSNDECDIGRVLVFRNLKVRVIPTDTLGNSIMGKVERIQMYALQDKIRLKFGRIK